MSEKENHVMTFLDQESQTPPISNGTATMTFRRKSSLLNSRLRLFYGFLLLLLLALIIPVLVLVGLLYRNSERTQHYAGSQSSLNALLSSQPQLLPKEETEKMLTDPAAASSDGDDMRRMLEQTYALEPWKRDATAAWKSFGMTLAQSADPTSDPCTDVYGSVCGQWTERATMTLGKNVRTDRQTEFEHVVRSMVVAEFARMSNDDGQQQWPTSVRTAKRFYDLCSARSTTIVGEIVQFFDQLLQKDVVRNRNRRAVVEETTTTTTTELVTGSRVGEQVTVVESVALVNASGTTAADAGVTTSAVEVSSTVVTPTAAPDTTVVVAAVVTSEVTSTVETTTAANENATVVLATMENATVAVVAWTSESDNATGTTAETSDSTVVLVAENSTATAEWTEQPDSNWTTTAVPESTTTYEGNETSTVIGVLVETVKNATLINDGYTVETATESSSSPASVSGSYTENDVIRMSGELIAIGCPNLLTVSYSVDPASNQSTIVVKPASLTFDNRQSYQQTNGWNRLVRTVIDQSMTGARSRRNTQSSDTFNDLEIKAIYDLEKSLSNAISLEDDFPSASMHKSYSYQALEQRWPLIDWSTLFDAIFDNTLSESQNVTVYDVGYIDRLSGLLIDYDKSTLMSFLKWRYLYSVRDLTAVTTADETSDVCYDIIQKHMPLVVANVIRSINYSLTEEESKQLVYTNQSIEYLYNASRDGLRTSIDFSSSIDSSSKVASLNQLPNVNLIYDWPSFVVDGSQLDEIYDRLLMLNNDSSLIDYITVIRAPYIHGEEIDRWSRSVPAVFYQPQSIDDRSIAVVACPRILNNLMTQPPIAQYSNMGWQLIRELIKSLRIGGHLQTDSIDQCLINRYNNYCYSSPSSTKCADGAATVTENLADNLALEAAYKTYKSWFANSQNLLSSLTESNLEKYTSDQVFFFAYGAQFCQQLPNEQLERLIAEKHMPNTKRLESTTDNFVEYRLAFHCKSSDSSKSMSERCKL